jgi:hypothetical protein
VSNSDENGNGQGPLRWPYLLLAAFIMAAAGVLLLGLWSLPNFVPALAVRPTDTPSPTATPTATPVVFGMDELVATADEEALTLTFRAQASAPSSSPLVEAVLWYDTEAGRETVSLPLPQRETVQLAYTATLATEGFTTTLTNNELDYWWLVRDTAGKSQRRGGILEVGADLAARAVAPTLEPLPDDFAWSERSGVHFAYLYQSDTAAARDLDQIADVAELALATITPTLHSEATAPLTVYLVPRLFWQGAAAYGGDTLLVSYLDRNYTGIETWSYFAHESVHLLAHKWIQPKDEGGPDGILVEGLAVWATGGHYYRDPIDQWAAAIAASDQYVPLEQLRTGDFYYEFQHEIAYHESASFVKYLIERNGLDTFRELYGQATDEPAHDEQLILRLYGAGYDELESEWLSWLAALPPDAGARAQWWLTVRFFDLLRLYQSELDPPARILPSDVPSNWEEPLLRDFSHRAQQPVNRLLETALIAAHDLIRKGDLEAAGQLMDQIEATVSANGHLIGSELVRRQQILDLLHEQDRAMLRADARALRNTLDPAQSLRLGTQIESEMQSYAFTQYEQELVALSMDDELVQARVLLHTDTLDGPHPDAGKLFTVTLLRRPEGWWVASREAYQPDLRVPTELR